MSLVCIAYFPVIIFLSHVRRVNGSQLIRTVRKSFLSLPSPLALSLDPSPPLWLLCLLLPQPIFLIRKYHETGPAR